MRAQLELKKMEVQKEKHEAYKEKLY